MRAFHWESIKFRWIKTVSVPNKGSVLCWPQSRLTDRRNTGPGEVLCEFLSGKDLGRSDIRIVFQGWGILALVEMTKGHDKTKYFWLWHIYKHTGKCSLSHLETQDSGTLEREQKPEWHLWAAESVCPDFTGRHQPKVLVATAVVPGAIAGEWKCYHRTLFSKTVPPPGSKESTLIRTESAGKKATHPKLHSHFH